jgi:hypothetical protein
VCCFSLKLLRLFLLLKNFIFAAFHFLRSTFLPSGVAMVVRLLHALCFGWRGGEIFEIRSTIAHTCEHEADVGRETWIFLPFR